MGQQKGVDSGRRPVEESGADDYAIAAAIIAAILIVVIIAVVICSCCHRRYCRYLIFCPCQKRSRRDDILMGYIPANITVNPAALEQGIPDIFLGESQAGRFSLEPYSQDNSHSRDLDSATETSGTWSEYLRRAVWTGKSGTGLETRVPQDGPLESVPKCAGSQSNGEGREALAGDSVGKESTGQKDVENGVV